MSAAGVRTYAAGEVAAGSLDRRRAFPVSGDASARHRAESVAPRARVLDVWRAPGVRVQTRRPTAGIVVGMTIRTVWGDLLVTRVGSIAGWGRRVTRYPDGNALIDAEETRWDAREVLSVPTAAAVTA